MMGRLVVMFVLFGLVVPSAEAAEKTPGQVYLEYRSTVLKGKTFKDIEAYMPMDMLFGVTDVMKQQLFERHKSMAATEDVPKVVKADVKGDEADLQLEATWDFSKSGGSGKKPAKAVTRLLKKDGAWKIVVLPQWVAR